MNARLAHIQTLLATGSPTKFIPQKPVMKVSGMKMVATTVSRFMISLSRFDTAERCTSRAPVRMSR